MHSQLCECCVSDGEWVPHLFSSSFFVVVVLKHILRKWVFEANFIWFRYENRESWPNCVCVPFFSLSLSPPSGVFLLHKKYGHTHSAVNNGPIGHSVTLYSVNVRNHSSLYSMLFFSSTISLCVLITTFLLTFFMKKEKTEGGGFFFSHNNTIALLPYYQLIHFDGARFNFLLLRFCFSCVICMGFLWVFFSFSSFCLGGATV